MRVRVKIEGITNKNDLENAVKAGADALGFLVNFPESPRNLSMEKAAELMAIVPPFVSRTVALKANHPSELIAIHEELRADAYQVYGAEFKKPKGVRILRPFPVKDSESLVDLESLKGEFDALVLDSYRPGLQGGTGLTHDWSVSRKIRDLLHPIPIVLAGGLRPENVEEAIRIVRPYGVDVSSGVESSPGVKDRKKLTDFVERAKSVVLE